MSEASSIAGLAAITSWRKRIQSLRMPVSPSGMRARCCPVVAPSVRNTDSVSASGMLPTKWTSGFLCESPHMQSTFLFQACLVFPEGRPAKGLRDVLCLTAQRRPP